MSDHLIDFDLCYRDMTEKAFLLAETETSRAVFYPKSAVTISEDGPYQMNQVVLVSMPEWLAEREGLI